MLFTGMCYPQHSLPLCTLFIWPLWYFNRMSSSISFASPVPVFCFLDGLPCDCDCDC